VKIWETRLRNSKLKKQEEKFLFKLQDMINKTAKGSAPEHPENQIPEEEKTQRRKKKVSQEGKLIRKVN
jgi:hypothetical protein